MRSPSAPRSSAVRRCRSSARRHQGSIGSSPTAAPGGLATWSSRPARTGHRACPRASERRRCSRPTTTGTQLCCAPGGVLVVGASASGMQIADELSRAGRDVTLAVGRHTRMPRQYRGMDAFWWLQRTGRLARTIHEVSDPVAARREPSMQLVGRPGGQRHQRDLDLVTLQAGGVRLVGRFDGMQGTRARFRADLAEHVAAADLALHRLLDAVDEHIACVRTQRRGLAGGPAASARRTVADPVPRPRPRAHRHRAWSPPATVPTTRGSGCPSSRRTGASGRTAESPPHQACTWSASVSSIVATPPSSAVLVTTRGPSFGTCSTGSTAVAPDGLSEEPAA